MHSTTFRELVSYVWRQYSIVVLSRDNTNHQPLKYYYQLLLLYVNAKKAATLKPVGLVCPWLRCFARLSRLCPLWDHWMQQLGGPERLMTTTKNLSMKTWKWMIQKNPQPGPSPRAQTLPPEHLITFVPTICKYKWCKLLCKDVDCFYINI